MEPLAHEGPFSAGAEDSEAVQEQEFQLTHTVDSAISALKADFDTASAKARSVTTLLPEIKLQSKGLRSHAVCCLSQISELTTGARVPGWRSSCAMH